MFEVGDKIFYPMHGAGVVEAIEEKEIMGEKHVYYIIQMPFRNMQVMIPRGKTSNLGIRPLVDSDTLEKVFTCFHEEEIEQNKNPNQRYRLNMNKLKTGDIYEATEVIRDLSRLNRKKSLGTQEKTMLDHAQQFLISEMVYVNGIEQEQATDILSKVMEN